MHDYAFSAAHRGATPPALAAREEDFASRIAAALVDDVDEVLVVGHSSGAAIAVSVLAGLSARRSRATGSGPCFRF
jgi:alpha-beta hydrolase superfamily lysophospholipase